MKENKKIVKLTLKISAIATIVVYLVFYILPGRDYVTRYKYRCNTAQTYAQSGSRPETTAGGLLIPVYAKGLPEGVHAAILPRLELISGVLSQTDWGKKNGPIGNGNSYYNELREYFSKYKDHKAVQEAEKLTDMGYGFGTLLTIAMSFNEIPSLELPLEIPEYSALKSANLDEIKKFGKELSDLSQDMDFSGFFETHRDDYQKYVDESIKGHDSLKIINWLNNFYGDVYKRADYYTVFAPALFSSDGFTGYSITIPDNNGAVTAYQIVMPNRRSENEVKFTRGLNLEFLTIHEWGHPYVGQSLKANNGLVAKYQIIKLYQPMNGKMLAQSYNNLNSFLNEQVLRGVEAVACRELYGELSYWSDLTKSKNAGFYLTDFTVKQLEYYQKNRDRYKKFDEFIPYLFEQYNKNIANLLKQAPK